MANIHLHILHLLFILEASVASEELWKTSRTGSGTQEDTEHLTISTSYRDMVSINMFKLYDKYSKEPQREKDGNTVRSFKAVTGSSKNTECFQFNLSSIAESERILSATLHFLHRRPRHPRPLTCRRSRHPSCAHPPPPQHLLLHGTARNSASAALLANVSVLLRPPWRRGAWHVRDITAVLRQARASHRLLITAEVGESQGSAGRSVRERHAPPPGSTPYVLVYADDRAIDEPNSVALSLQRYGAVPVGEEGSRAASSFSPPSSASATAPRTRREAPPPLSLLDHIQTNDLPEVHYNALKNHELWQSTYFPPKAKATGGKHGRKHSQQESSSRGSSEGLGKVPEVLSFDERTMKKARRKQWSEPRVCARRYLRVDFADIGWSEWVLAPKAFDAYYCSGTCGFPIPKMVRPSNHATIQSIVRAVGIVPGVPEPCCVPDKMSSLPVLFLDPSRNLVLKVYPAMSVDTCTCR